MARRFDAAADRLLRTASLLDYNAAYTVLFWFYPVALPGSGVAAHLWGMNDASTNNRDRFLIGGLASTQVLRSTVTVAAAATTQDGATDLSVNTWYCGAFVRTSNANAQLYLGTLTTDLATQGSANTRSVSGRAAASRMEIGAERTANADAFSGRVKNVKIWARALTLAELICEQWILRPSVFNSIHLWTPLWTTNDNDYSGNARNWTATGLTDEDDPPIGYGAPIWTIIRQLPTGVTVDLSSLPATSTATAIAPSVIAGSLSLTPAAALATTSAVAPSVVLGSVSVTPTAAALATATAVDPTVEITGGGGGDVTVDLSSAPALATATAITPSVILGSVSVAPEAANALASAITPTITLGSVSVNLAASPATATTTALDPTVITAAAAQRGTPTTSGRVVIWPITGATITTRPRTSGRLATRSSLNARATVWAATSGRRTPDLTPSGSERA